jgi:pimeloyl-ACP methyl ester carboxylesterase
LHDNATARQTGRMSEIRTRRLDANGIRFAVDEAGDGDSVALLLHGFPEHGFPESRAAWRAQLPFLADLGWHALAPDLRGYGESTRLSGRAYYRIPHLVNDVASLFEVTQARRRLLIGHDWGGVIAWQVAVRRRIPLDGLVILNAPHPTVFECVIRQSWRQRARSWYVLFFQLPFLPESQLALARGAALKRILKAQSPNFPADVLDLYARNISQPGAAEAMINYYRANAFALAAAGQPRDRIEVPTLMIWGENDVALDIALTQGNEEFVADFTLKRLPGASHWVQEDASPEVNATIAGWLAAKGLTG